MKDFGKLDLLINSAAMLHPSGKGETSLRDVSQEVSISTLIHENSKPLKVRMCLECEYTGDNPHFTIKFKPSIIHLSSNSDLMFPLTSSEVSGDRS